MRLSLRIRSDKRRCSRGLFRKFSKMNIWQFAKLLLANAERVSALLIAVPGFSSLRHQATHPWR